MTVPAFVKLVPDSSPPVDATPGVPPPKTSVPVAVLVNGSTLRRATSAPVSVRFTRPPLSMPLTLAATVPLFTFRVASNWSVIVPLSESVTPGLTLIDPAPPPWSRLRFAVPQVVLAITSYDPASRAKVPVPPQIPPANVALPINRSEPLTTGLAVPLNRASVVTADVPGPTTKSPELINVAVPPIVPLLSVIVPVSFVQDGWLFTSIVPLSTIEPLGASVIVELIVSVAPSLTVTVASGTNPSKSSSAMPIVVLAAMVTLPSQTSRPAPVCEPPL